MTELLLPLVSLTGISLALCLGFHAALAWWLRQGRPSPRSAEGVAPPVSVLKPLKGAEPGLYELLASWARQDYPRFELVLGTEDPADPALEVAARLQRDFPAVAITVTTQAPPLGFNPKVNNLANLSARARYDWVLVSDADTRPEPGMLRALTAELEANPEAGEVGMVACVFAGVGEQDLGAACENLHFASFVSPSVAAAQLLAGHPVVVGKSMLFRRSDLDRVGGWATVANVLAEDYLLGRHFAAAGLRIAVCPRPLPVVNQHRALATFLSRHQRWGQMRRRINPPAYLGELLLNPIGWAALTGLGAATLGLPEGWSAGTLATGLAATVALKAVADVASLRRLRGGPFAARLLPLVPFKDLLIFALWPVGLLKKTIQWRGHRLEIRRGSALVPCEPLPAEVMSRP